MTYELDLTATNPKNYIRSSHQRPANTAKWFFVLNGGTFYTKDLQVINSITGRELHPLTDYRALELDAEAVNASGGKEACKLIYITNETVKSVIIRRRVVGGHFQHIGSDLINILDDDNINDLTASSWNQVVGEPHQYKPKDHQHMVGDVYGLEHVVYLLNDIAQAVETGDSHAFGMIYQYIDRLKAAAESNISTQLNDAKKQVDVLKESAKLPNGQIVMFNNNINPAAAFGYGQWKRLEDTLLFGVPEAQLGLKKKVGEGTDYLMTGIAAWVLVSGGR